MTDIAISRCHRVVVDVERCDECGFNGDDWTDDAAIDAIAGLQVRWRQATQGLEDADARRRPIADTWSVAEYADHVREVLFSMRFVLESAASSPGIDLGSSPETSFDPEPRPLDLSRALAGIEREVTRLVDQLTELAPETWAHTAVIDGDAVDGHWICRHAVHDATHHLMDVDRIRSALSDS